jgi:hypothetical protein
MKFSGDKDTKSKKIIPYICIIYSLFMSDNDGNQPCRKRRRRLAAGGDTSLYRRQWTRKLRRYSAGVCIFLIFECRKDDR